MTPAIKPLTLDEAHVLFLPDIPAPWPETTTTPPTVVTLAATISTRDGRFITGGIIEVSGTDAGWRARMRHLDRPGLVASMYFAEGVRDVVVKLEDGRRGTARITGTSFIAASQRVCDLAGTEPLA